MTSHVTVDEVLHDAALFVHLSSLILGFGAVLAVDWTALRWVLGHRPFHAVLTTAGHVHGAIWLGYAGLVASGLLLSPNLSSAWTVVKLVLVLLIGWNGLAAMALQRHLEKSDGGPGGRGMLVASCSAGLSQACWWGATVIGFINAR